MRYELFIGLRYLRAKRREAFISLITIISTLGVAIGVMTLTIVLAVMTGFEEDLRDRILAFNPHVSIWGALGPMEGFEEVAAKARAVPGVVRAEPFVYDQLMLSTPEHFAGVLVRGIPPTAAANPDLAARLRQGSIEQLDRSFAVPLHDGRGATVQLPGIILGGELAKKLAIKSGETVSVASAPSAAAALPRIRTFVVVGEFDSGMPEYDSGLAYVGLGDARRLFDLGETVTGIEVKIADLYQAQAVAARLRTALGPGVRVRDWMEANHNLFAALKLQKTVYFIVLLLIILVAAFTVLATLIMVVMEKRKDIAVLKSMGAPNAAIARIFILKGLVIGGLGTLLGNLGGYAGCWLLQHYTFVDLPKDIFYVSTVPVKVEPQYFVIVTVAALLICLLATLYPARQAARLVPVDLIRYE
ncbi:MAG: FtsX-like permease family protein [Candidatus Binatia bacterium]